MWWGGRASSARGDDTIEADGDDHGFVSIRRYVVEALLPRDRVSVLVVPNAGSF